MRDAEGNPQFAIALFEDITERRESEERILTYQTQLQSLASELTLTEERERRRLATVLHDHVAQLLMMAKVKFEKMQESTIYRDLAKSTEEIRELIEESIRCTRSLVFELSPPILYDLGFEPAMEWLAEHMEKQYGLVVQELLFNVIKHAKVNYAWVVLHGDGEHIRVIVKDNGVGFAPDRLGASSDKLENYGIFSIRERLNYFGGDIEIESTPGQGARVIMTMPLKVNQEKAVSPTNPSLHLS